jgi:hypothetical protein
MPEDLGGPYVQIAAFCHTALKEASGQLSIIRIQDRVRVPVPTKGDTMAAVLPVVQVTLAVVLKSGFRDGKATITIRPKTPNGVDMPPAQFPALFEGKERGVQIILPMAMQLPEEGLYWFEILVDDVTVTKVPLRVIHQQLVQVQMQKESPPGQ